MERRCAGCSRTNSALSECKILQTVGLENSKESEKELEMIRIGRTESETRESGLVKTIRVTNAMPTLVKTTMIHLHSFSVFTSYPV